MKKILFFSKWFAMGGSERHITNLANSFVENGYAVDILVIDKIKNRDYLLNPKVRLISIGDGMNSSYSAESSCARPNVADKADIADNNKVKTASSTKRSKQDKVKKKSLVEAIKTARPVKNLSYFKNYRPYFKESNPDIIITFTYQMYERAYYASIGMRCKLIFASMSAFKIEFPSKDSADYSHAVRIIKRASLIISQTKDSQYSYSKILRNTIVIHNPIMKGLPEPYSGIRNKTIVSFCRINAVKNLGLLISAFQKLHYDHSDYQLMICGNAVTEQEKIYLKKLTRNIHDIGLDDSVLILPGRKKIHDFILKSAMYVSSSDYEGLSNSMLEAMAIGLPCVCTDCIGGGTREVMVDHENGLIVPMKDPDAMYRAMKEYIDNPMLAKKCSRNAVKIRDQLDRMVIADQWLKVIESV